MSRVIVNRNGNCPYCSSSNFDATQNSERRPNYIDMLCLDCNNWSVRKNPLNYQYPIQVPTDQSSSITKSMVLAT